MLVVKSVISTLSWHGEAYCLELKIAYASGTHDAYKLHV